MGAGEPDREATGPSTPSRGSDEVAGRDAEMARLAEWLDRIPSGTCGAILGGESGMGKTTLLRWALDRFRRTGDRVLVARPAEEELSLGLSALIDLFEGRSDVPFADPKVDPIERGRGALQTLRTIAAGGPVLVAVDDLQWLDAPSARALRYALRRLDAEPIGVVVTSSDPERSRRNLDLASLLPAGRVETVSVGPLDLAAIRTVVGRVTATISPRQLRHINEISGGNPLFALEMARHLSTESRATSVDPTTPRSLFEAMGLRLGSVDQQLLPLLEVVAAAVRITVTELAAPLADDTSEDDVAPLVAAAEKLGLLTVDDHLVVRFAHPAMAPLVYSRMSPLQRRDLHARLATSTADPDLRARHLARGTDTPDAATATALEVAAGRASDRGELGAAAELAHHAVRLTPPTDPETLRRRRLDLARHLAAAGDMGAALATADALIDDLAPGPGRAEVLVERAQLEDDDLDRGEALLVQALSDAGDDEALRGRVLDQLGWLRGVFRGDLAAGIQCGEQALALAVAGTDREFEMSAAAGLSNMRTLAGSPDPDLMDRAVALEDEIGRPPLWSGPKVLRAEQLLWAGELDRARRILEEAVAHADRQNHERWRPYSLYDLASVESAAGNLARADELLAAAMESARDCEDTHVESWVFYRLALVAAWLGRVDGAREAARRRVDLASRRGERTGVARARSVLGLLALSMGDITGAMSGLNAAVDLLDEMGFAHPGAIPAVPDAIEAAALGGDTERASVLLRRLEAQAQAVGSRWVDVAVERAAGTVRLADGDVDAAAQLVGAAARFGELGFKPDAARATFLAGRALLRANQRTAAAEALSAALRSFDEMGAVLWSARTAEELERASPGRSSGALTTAERRVAALVARGATNREIAAELFMSVATVEAHLTRIYRKLELRSRTELTRMVTEGNHGIAP
ncbi:MAG TPA: AAA family ATPase [Acidimicrobiia bacterium]|jgi:DNA-binding CsgD family transcriptional regulator